LSPSLVSKKNHKKRTATVIPAEIIPKTPISFAIASSFCCSGVSWSGFDSSVDLILPWALFSPTTITKKYPSPVSIFVPERRTGEGKAWINQF